MKNSAVCILILLVSSQFILGQTIYTGFDYNFTNTVTSAQNCLINSNVNYSGIIRNVGDGTGVNDISKAVDNSLQIISNSTVTSNTSNSQKRNGYSQNPIVFDIFRSFPANTNSCEKLDNNNSQTGGYIDMSVFKKVKIIAKASSPMRLRFELGNGYISSTSQSNKIFEMSLSTYYQEFYFDYNGKFGNFDSTKINTIRLKFNVGPQDDSTTGFTGIVNISSIMLGEVVDSAQKPINSLPIISGKAFFDLNDNQIMDNTESPAANKKITFRPGNNFIFTDGEGNYSYSVESSYFHYYSSINYVYVNSSDQFKTVSGVSFNSISTTNFVYKKLKDGKDIAIKSVIGQNAARPGFSLVNYIQIENKGTVSVPTTLKFDFPSTYTPYGFGNMTCNTITSTCTYTVGTLKPGAMTIIPIDGVLSPLAPLGDTLKFNYQVNPNDALDIDSTSNKSGITYVVTGSYDPNDKAATPYLDPQKAALSQWIDYTIRFQNTGTDTAFTVMVVDTLPDKLIASSLEMISTSHKYTFSQKDQITTFKFSSILLPDSNINEKKSHGYIKFRVKTKTGLTSNETIRNMASIYFDFNSPVLTNYAETTFLQARVTATQSDDLYKENEAFVYSNPVEGDRFYIKSEKQEDAKLYNFSGICVFSGKVGKEGIFVGNLPKGIYLFQIGNHREKVILK